MNDQLFHLVFFTKPKTLFLCSILLYNFINLSYFIDVSHRGLFNLIECNIFKAFMFN